MLAQKVESEDEIVEVPIEAAQEYVAGVLGFAPLQLSDDNNLSNLVDKFKEFLIEKFGQYLSPKKVEALIHMLKLKLQAQENFLFNKFDSFLIGEVFYLNENVVLLEDTPQLKYSKTRADAVQESIAKHEENIYLLALAKEKMDKEIAELKIVEDALTKATSILDENIKKVFGMESGNEFVRFVEEYNLLLNSFSSQ